MHKLSQHSKSRMHFPVADRARKINIKEYENVI